MQLKSFLFLLALASSSSLVAQHKLKVEVTDINKVEGAVEICLFDSDENYMRDALKCVWIDVKEASVKHSFDSVPEGDYAVVVIQDLNENRDLDTNFMGIPKEPYGFSNNPSTTFGPPSFEGASFQIAGEKIIQISLK